MSEAAWAIFEGSHHVEAPNREWPGGGDGLQLLRWQVSLPSVELASFTPTDNLLCVSKCSGPVETLAKGFLDQQPWGHVMSVDSSVDLEEELFPLVGRDTLHEYSRWTSFVKFVTDGEEHLGASSDPSCFSLFW